MLDIFWKEAWVTAVMLFFFGCGIAARIAIGIFYGSLIRETENMAVTKNPFLKQCKTKYIHCFQLNGGVHNVSAFVEKSIGRLMIGPFSLEGMNHFAGQSMLLSVVAAGVGICDALAGGETLMRIFPFYIACFAGLYLYFSVTALVDAQGKKMTLKIHLVDYLENHLSSRIGMTQSDLEKLHYIMPGEKMSDYRPEERTAVRSEEQDTAEKQKQVPGKLKESESPATVEEWEALLNEILMI